MTKSSKMKVKTVTGKLPNSFGFPGGKCQGGGVILTRAYKNPKHGRNSPKLKGSSYYYDKEIKRATS